MEMEFETSCVTVLYVLLLVFWLIYLYFVKNYGYWEQREIPHVSAVFPLGSLSEALVFSNVNLALAYDDIYNQFKGHRFCGIIEVRTPSLVIRDPDLIRRILTTDSDHFMDRPSFEGNPKEYMTRNLFTMKGEQWKVTRNKLVPAYSRTKMKMVYIFIEKCIAPFKEYMEEIVSKHDEINVKDVLAKLAMDITTNCIFGPDINALGSERLGFYSIIPLVFQYDSSFLRNQFIYNAFPIFRKVYYRKIDLVKPEVKEFLTKFIYKIVRRREEHNLQRSDFLDLLIKIRQNKSILEDRETNGLKNHSTEITECLTIKEVAGEVMAFLGGGTEKVSSCIAFCLYHLSYNPHIQERLHKEVKETLQRHNGVVSYQAIQEMTYMDQVIHETLRLHPSVPVLQRSCTREYKVPNSSLVIEQDVRIVIPVYSLHRDPLYFPKPEQFDPQRFAPDTTSMRHPFVYLPFGEGHRKCIGMHYGMMQIKSGLATLINDFEIGLPANTKTPIEIKSKSYLLQPEEPLMLIFKKRKSK